jgi:hypothetical protein
MVFQAALRVTQVPSGEQEVAQLGQQLTDFDARTDALITYLVCSSLPHSRRLLMLELSVMLYDMANSVKQSISYNNNMVRMLELHLW